MKMNSYITRAKLEDVMHTSGYAKAQNGSNFGASGGGRTFAQRQSVDYRNSRVKQYSQSMLGRNDLGRRGAVLESVNSTQERISQNRQIREENFAGNRQTSTVSAGQIEKSTAQAMARSQSLEGRFDSVSQSGVAGFRAGGSGVSGGPSTAGGFFNIKPKF